MSRRIFLLSDDAAFRQLRAAGMSDEILIDGEQAGIGDVASTGDFVIVRRDPAVLIPQTQTDEDVDAEPQLDVEHRDELFASLLGSVVCHLVVLENEPGQVKTGQDAVVLKNGTSINHLKKWYKAFQRQVARRVEYRQHEYKHVLILVAADDIPNKHLAALQAVLQGENGKRTIDICYVMLRRLNWASRHVCHSRYVWPLSVSRLLTYLLATNEEVGVTENHGGETTTVAWRGMDLVPEIPASLLEDHCARRMREAYETIFEEREGSPHFDTKAFEPDEHLPKEQLKEQPLAAYDSWYTYRCASAVANLAKPQRWTAQLIENGRQFSARLGGRVVADDAESWKEVGRCWRNVHDTPAFLSVALSHPQVAKGPDVDSEMKQLVDDFGELSDLLRSREAAIDNAEQCAIVLEEAQRGFVNPVIRLILAASAAMFVFYAAVMLFYHLLSPISAEGFAGPLKSVEVWTVALMVAAAGVAGAALAALVPLYLEHRAGTKAVETFRNDLLTEIDRQTIKRDWACQQLLSNGYVFWMRARAASAMRRLTMLLKRVHTMVQRELLTRNPVELPADAYDDFAELEHSGAPRQIHQRQQQQQEYAEQTRISYETDAFCPDEKALDSLVKSRVSAFVDGWRDLSRKHDRAAAGNLPARVWVHMLRDFRDRFLAVISDELYRQAVVQLTADRHGDWTSKLRDVINQDYDYYLSCPVTAAEVEQESRQTRLLLRPELEPDLGTGLQGITIDKPEMMQTLPVLGLLFDQVPIQLGEGEDGMIRATVYET
jgi:hypothetical protein